MAKNVIAELNKDVKLNSDNYNTWHRRIQYVLEEQEIFETLNHILVEPKHGTNAQSRRDHDAYMAWKKKNGTARITMLSAMQDDLMCEYEKYQTAKELWDALKEQFGSTSAAKVRKLTIKFDTYVKRQHHSIPQHLREMGNMIRELEAADHKLSDEQQVQAVIRSLPQSWEHMKVQLTHDGNVKTFKDVCHHVELEDERLEATKGSSNVFIAESSKRESGKRKRGKRSNRKKILG